MPMPVEIQKTDIEGVVTVKTGLFRDDRGFFSESYSEKMWNEAGFSEDFKQDNVSLSAKGVLRGLHYQINPEPMGKLVRCLQGRIYDVAVDLRKDSPTFGQYAGIELSGENQLSFWVPVGFAHGFVSMEDNSLVHYKCTNHHAPDCERALSWKCPKVGIEWPMQPTIISEKDDIAPGLDDADYNF